MFFYFFSFFLNKSNHYKDRKNKTEANLLVHFMLALLFHGYELTLFCLRDNVY